MARSQRRVAEAIRALRAGGWSTRAIARRIFVSERSIQRYAREKTSPQSEYVLEAFEALIKAEELDGI